MIGVAASWLVSVSRIVAAPTDLSTQGLRKRALLRWTNKELEMIIRIMVVDPRPRETLEDVIVYQVPEKSRAYELLVEMLSDKGLDFVEITSRKISKRKGKKEKKGDSDPTAN